MSMKWCDVGNYTISEPIFPQERPLSPGMIFEWEKGCTGWVLRRKVGL
jgi:hypothetical protein